MHDHVHTTPDRPPGIPGRLWELILACLGKDPDHRPPAAALARALRDPAFPLDAITAAPPVPPVPVSASATSSGMVAPPRTGTGTPPPAAPARPGGGRRRWTWAAAAALVVAGAVAATALAESAGNGPGGPAAAATPTVSLRGVTASGSRTPHSVARTCRPRHQLARVRAGPDSLPVAEPVRAPRQRLPHRVGDAHQDATAGHRVDVRRGHGRHARHRPPHRPDAAGLYPRPRRRPRAQGHAHRRRRRLERAGPAGPEGFRREERRHLRIRRVRHLHVYVRGDGQSQATATGPAAQVGPLQGERRSRRARETPFITF